jgi:hypothetical protein
MGPHRQGLFRRIDAPWLVLYAKRRPRAPLTLPEGTPQQRDRGTPQGSADSPVLANLFMHRAFDTWMTRERQSLAQHPRRPRVERCRLDGAHRYGAVESSAVRSTSTSEQPDPINKAKVTSPASSIGRGTGQGRTSLNPPLLHSLRVSGLAPVSLSGCGWRRRSAVAGGWSCRRSRRC